MGALADRCDADRGGLRFEGDRHALERLRARLPLGLRVYAVGGSITADFGGCFGVGCTAVYTSNQSRFGSTPRSPYGYLSGLMQRVNASFPGANHAAYNRAMGGSDCKFVHGCLRSFVPEGAADLVVIEYGVNLCSVQQSRDIVGALQAYNPPPAIAFLQNFRWCEGETANASDPCQHDTHADNVERLLRARPGKRHHEMWGLERQLVVESTLAHCGAAVLSAYFELLPSLIMGPLRTCHIACRGDGGVHPNRASRGERHDVLTRTLIDLLVRWLLGVGAPPVGGACELLPTRSACAGTPSCRSLMTSRLLVTSPPLVTNGSGHNESCAATGGSRSCYGTHYWMPALRVTNAGGFVWEKRPVDATGKYRTGSYKPGWVSRQGGDVLGVALAEMGDLHVQVYLLHSYANVSAACLTCGHGCWCEPTWRATQWRLPWSASEPVGIRVHSPRPDACELRVSNEPLRSVCVATAAPTRRDIAGLWALDPSNATTGQVKVDAVVVSVIGSANQTSGARIDKAWRPPDYLY